MYLGAVLNSDVIIARKNCIIHTSEDVWISSGPRDLNGLKQRMAQKSIFIVTMCKDLLDDGTGVCSIQPVRTKYLLGKLVSSV